MKSIGIITIHNSQNNYGGALQCFGLYEYLRQEGYDVELIDLHRPNNADFVDSVRFPMMRAKYGFRTYIKGLVKDMLGIRKLRNLNFVPNWNPDAGLRFCEFNKRVKMSAPYTYIPDLYKKPPKYDVYISGSDQLWNPDQPYCLEPYFLTFIKKKSAIKLSYGTSIGVTVLRENERRKFKKWLSDYDVVSVRERQASVLLEELTGKSVYRVPDPTFLLDPEQWVTMSVKPEEKDNYILIFNLGYNEALVRKGIEIATAMNCKVKIIEQNYNGLAHPSVEIVADAGPLEFIGLIRSARLILTNSFHCTVFSLITGARNFYTYIAPDSTRGSRIEDLLEIYGLSGHIVRDMDSIPSVSELEKIEIDSTEVRRILKDEQTVGRAFLKKALDLRQ